ncbi:MAG: hypothetical protein MZV65_43935 [Chromatiales bacterium]|nr:hypothetical protein [Chromatiales bacterium]
MAGAEAWPASPSTRSRIPLDRPDAKARDPALLAHRQGAVPDRRPRRRRVLGLAGDLRVRQRDAMPGRCGRPTAPARAAARVGQRRDALGLRRAAQQHADGHPRAAEPRRRAQRAGGRAADIARIVRDLGRLPRARRQRRPVPVRRVLDRRRRSTRRWCTRFSTYGGARCRRRWPAYRDAHAGAAADAGSGSPPHRPRPEARPRRDWTLARRCRSTPVGGCVRDAAARPAGRSDRDWVVVGATPEADGRRAASARWARTSRCSCIRETHEEYALARTERKTAPGYHGFAFHAAPDVTLEEDLARRDLTINAIARDDDGTLIDPLRRPRRPRGAGAAPRRRRPSPRTRCASCAWRASPRASPTSRVAAETLRADAADGRAPARSTHWCRSASGRSSRAG